MLRTEPAVRIAPGRRCDYHPTMAKLLLNLRNVPDDEADDVRAFLDADGIGWYETRPSLFGLISWGGIWIREDADFPRARKRMDAYQWQRRERVRAEHAQARRDGAEETFADLFRAQPLRVALILVAIALLLGLAAVPWLLLRA